MAIVILLLFLLASKNHKLNCCMYTRVVSIVIVLVFEIAKYIFNNSCPKSNYLAFSLWTPSF